MLGQKENWFPPRRVHLHGLYAFVHETYMLSEKIISWIWNFNFDFDAGWERKWKWSASEKISPHSSKQLMNLKSSKWNSQIAIRYFLWIILDYSHAHVFKMYTHNWLCFSSLVISWFSFRWEIMIASSDAGWLLALGVLGKTNPF